MLVVVTVTGMTTVLGVGHVVRLLTKGSEGHGHAVFTAVVDRFWVVLGTVNLDIGHMPGLPCG